MLGRWNALFVGQSLPFCFPFLGSRTRCSLFIGLFALQVRLNGLGFPARAGFLDRWRAAPAIRSGRDGPFRNRLRRNRP